MIGKIAGQVVIALIVTVLVSWIGIASGIFQETIRRTVFDWMNSHLSVVAVQSDPLFKDQFNDATCTSGHLVGASCYGKDAGGHIQVAVGPQISGNSAHCDRYGSVVMPITVTALCLIAK